MLAIVLEDWFGLESDSKKQRVQFVSLSALASKLLSLAINYRFLGILV